MKNNISKLIISAMVLLIASCEQDSALTTLEAVQFANPVVASPSTIVLTNENKYESVVTISWEDVVFPIEAPVSYVVEIDIASDTFGATPWANAIRMTAGEDVLSKSFLGGELNDIAIELGLAPDVQAELVVRIEATMDRKVYSEPIVLTVTPFTETVAFGQIYMPGGYQNWDPASAAVLNAIDTGIYEGYLTFPVGQSLEFKFTTEPNWDNAYGLDSNGNFAEGGISNLSVPAPGSYKITVNLNTVTFTAVPYSWGIIGTATAGGWDADTDMVYDYVEHLWKYTGPLISGAVKFRLNDAWTINYGPAGGPSGETTNGIVLLDNPGAHTIVEAGNYEITYTHDPENPASAVYTVTQL